MHYFLQNLRQQVTQFRIMPCGSQLNSGRFKMGVETEGEIKMADFYVCFV